MASGKVKDPTGHQSGPYDFGYIKRLDNANWPEPDPKNDPGFDPEDDPKKKVIPYLNRVSPNENLDPVDPETQLRYILQDKVDFDVIKAKVIGLQEPFENVTLGTIGVAVKVRDPNKK